MSELNSLIDSIRQAERTLSDVATRKAVASQAASKASEAVCEQVSNIERLSLSGRTLEQAQTQLRTVASRALRRGLLPAEIDQALAPLANASAIRAATKILIEAKDTSAKTMLELERISAEANQALKAIEIEFSGAETQLEDLRDQLRIMQQATV
jgi:hypothetical protein